MKELRDWLNQNEAHLKDYTIEEKAELAIAAGLDRMVVAQWKTQMRYQEAI